MNIPGEGYIPATHEPLLITSPVFEQYNPGEQAKAEAISLFQGNLEGEFNPNQRHLPDCKSERVNFGPVTVGITTDRGKERSGKPNEDTGSVAFIDTNGFNFTLAAVFDGLGGEVGGKEASESLPIFLKEALIENLKTIKNRGLDQILADAAIQADDRYVKEIKKPHTRSGAAGAVALVDNKTGTYYVFRVGDSRVAISDPNEERLNRLNLRDESKVVETLGIAEDDIYTNYYRNVINNHFGALRTDKNSQKIKPSVVTGRLESGQKLLLYTDGIWEMIQGDHRTKFIADSTLEPAEASRRLVAYAHSQGGADNETAVVLQWTNPNRPQPIKASPAGQISHSPMNREKNLNKRTQSPEPQPQANPDQRPQYEAQLIEKNTLLPLTPYTLVEYGRGKNIQRFIIDLDRKDSPIVFDMTHAINYSVAPEQERVNIGFTNDNTIYLNHGNQDHIGSLRKENGIWSFTDIGESPVSYQDIQDIHSLEKAHIQRFTTGITTLKNLQSLTINGATYSFQPVITTNNLYGSQEEKKVTQWQLIDNKNANNRIPFKNTIANKTNNIKNELELSDGTKLTILKGNILIEAGSNHQGVTITNDISTP